VLGDLGPVALAVDRLCQAIQDLGQLDDLPVRAARDEGRVLEAGVLELAGELDAVREGGPG
jgi:hypothetical protein